MQANGILVIKDTGFNDAQWSSTNVWNGLPDGNAVLTLQDDGNLAVTYNGKTIWNSGTEQADALPAIDLSKPRDRLRAGEMLEVDQSLTSSNGRFRFTLHDNGKAVLMIRYWTIINYVLRTVEENGLRT
jgi:hypothetical protein